MKESESQKAYMVKDTWKTTRETETKPVSMDEPHRRVPKTVIKHYREIHLRGGSPEPMPKGSMPMVENAEDVVQHYYLPNRIVHEWTEGGHRTGIHVYGNLTREGKKVGQPIGVVYLRNKERDDASWTHQAPQWLLGLMDNVPGGQK